MQDAVQKEILKAFFLVLKPMARMLLRFGVSYKDFNEIVKTAFVDVASADYGIRGRPTNISRVAVMTGMTRKEVRRIRDSLTSGEEVVQVRHGPLMQLIHNWFVDERFLDHNGQPATLPFLGKGATFEGLVRATGGDIPPGAIRTELKRVGAVVENSDGSLTVVKRSFRPIDAHDNLVGTLVHCVYPLMANMADNTNPDYDGFRHPVTAAYTLAVSESEVPRLRRISAKRITDFAESMDDVFASYEMLRDDGTQSDDEETGCIHVCAFYYEDFADIPFALDKLDIPK